MDQTTLIDKLKHFGRKADLLSSNYRIYNFLTLINADNAANANSLREKLNGILLPTTTCFDPRGQLAHEPLRQNLEKWAARGVKGFVMLGSTGERVHLDETEYVEVIESARLAVTPDVAFIVGAGQQSTVGTIKEIEKAAKAGADAVLVITPSFYRSAVTQETLIKHYSLVANAAPVPVILYSMPALTGVKIEPATVGRLSEHPNIIGVKDSSADVEGLGLTVESCPREFAVMTGNGTILLEALKAGAAGAILAVGCAVPEVCVEMLHKFQDGEISRAEELQSKLTPLATAVTTKYGIGGLKAALDMSGYSGGEVRAPLQMPDAEAKADIAQLLAEVNGILEKNRGAIAP